MSQPGTSSLPLHPTARHPRTGALIRALYVRSDGRVMWPILGASPDDEGGEGGGSGGDGGGSGDTGATGSGAGGANGGAANSSGGGQDPGFPANTPVAEMTLEQQVAYHKHQSRKHETRSREWQQIAGDRTPDQVKADLEAAEKLRKEQMTDAQRQVEEAKEQTRAEAAKVFGTSAARVALEFALGHDPEKNDQSGVIDALDLSKLLTDDGQVDTAKVRALVTTIAPSDKGTGNQRHDFGGGNRGGNTSTGVAAGRSRYMERHGKKSDKDA